MGSLLPLTILCVSIGVFLAFETKRVIWLALMLLSLTALLVVYVSLCSQRSANIVVFWQKAAIWGCWASVFVTALLVQLPWRRPTWLIWGIAANAGLWFGGLFVLAAKPAQLLWALPCFLVAFPLAALLKTPARFGVNIIAGWLVAIAIMAAAIPLSKAPLSSADHIE